MIEAFSSLLKWPLTFDEEKHVIQEAFMSKEER